MGYAVYKLNNNIDLREEMNIPPLKHVIRMSKQEYDKTYFVSFCIEQYKMFRGISGTEVADMFYANHIAEYLNDNYEVLHTQSRQWLMEEIEERLNASETV